MDSIEYRDRREAQRQAEAEGKVADSMEVRKALMQRFHNGEITLEQAQAELAKIKRNAKSNGQITRDQAFTS
ncbi:hypothetical protein [Rhizobium leguminosarum]|uniref:hypothetical protein n=1 Tax=Rhizobium leguminosarum TaxID=384 RepID=UPI0016209F36|nr:hypothetical protein [Rhizobium leguminosarum]MBB4342107.1 hypothetical protein [Rhizobium leguminosarum]MBB6294731.1 hypothetical protein [Rhizobium leguminosarum]